MARLPGSRLDIISALVALPQGYVYPLIPAFLLTGNPEHKPVAAEMCEHLRRIQSNVEKTSVSRPSAMI